MIMENTSVSQSLHRKKKNTMYSVLENLNVTLLLVKMKNIC